MRDFSPIYNLPNSHAVYTFYSGGKGVLADQSFRESMAALFKGQPSGTFDIRKTIHEIKDQNFRDLCRTSTTIDARWHADFGKSFEGKLVQVEAQFGMVEAMFKDFCGFRMAYSERRLALGIEIVMADPRGYFEHRKSAVSGMARFDMAQGTMNTIGLDCPIWLIGISE